MQMALYLEYLLRQNRKGMKGNGRIFSPDDGDYQYGGVNFGNDTATCR